MTTPLTDAELARYAAKRQTTLFCDFGVTTEFADAMYERLRLAEQDNEGLRRMCNTIEAENKRLVAELQAARAVCDEHAN